MEGVCQCGNYKCLIKLYWKGNNYEYRKDNDGDLLTYKKAINKLIEINNSIRNHAFNPTDYTDSAIKERKFTQMMEKWLDQKAEEEQNGELSPETLRCYRSYARNHFQFFETYDVREIAYEYLEDFKDELPKHLSLKMKRNIMNALHSFFTWLRKRKIVKDIPLFPEIKGDDAQVRVAIDRDEQERGLSNIPDEHRDIYLFLFETGVRIGEVCAFKIRDLDMRNSMILVQRTRSGNKIVETTKGKNKKWIPMSDIAFEIVKKLIQGHTPEHFIFINPGTKRPYSQEFLRKLWRTHSDVNVTLYEASRHSFCTQIVEGGAKLDEAQQLMRHADIRSTQNYFHGSTKRLKGVVNNRGKVIPFDKKRVSEPK